jgi:hypothetical protein
MADVVTNVMADVVMLQINSNKCFNDIAVLSFVKRFSAFLSHTFEVSSDSSIDLL